jgi:hypothetical protein
MARPKIEINEDEVFELAKIQCTNDEIAAVFGVSEVTIRNRFSAIVAKWREAGKKSLRRAQWEKAVKDGNVVMQIWLGKQYLGQRDKSDLDLQTGVSIIWDESLAKI